jgi:DNA-binding NarL/FixJ family response regulator
MLKRKSYAWTPEDELSLKQLAEKGVHIRAIALRLRRSESSIKKRARELGVKAKLNPRGNFRVAR